MLQTALCLYDQNIWGNMAPDQRIANRNQLIRDLIVDRSPDVCCFQECNPATSRQGDNAIQRLLADRYPEAPTAAGERNFTPIFYRPDKWRLIDSGWHLYTGGPQYNDGDSKSITWAVLEDRDTAVRCGVCSSHFWWKSDTALDNAQRLQNAEELCAVMDTIAARYDIPVLAAGDFNCGAGADQGAAPYRALLAKGLLDARTAADQTTDQFTHHEYPILGADGCYRDGARPVRTLDHIFATPHPRLQVRRFAVDVSQRALDSSDHCPLLCDCVITD